MIVYLLKFIACSGVLLLFYHFVLQSDRLFKFNRFFLLAIVGLALLIPITTVRTNYIEIPVTSTVDPIYAEMANSEDSLQSLPQEIITAEVTSAPIFTTERIFIGSYLLVTLLLLIRFGRNLFAISRLKKDCIIIKENDINIALRSDISTSFSFLNYMFTNKERYEQGNLPEEIILHEKLHIKQYHSIDIIFIELLQCFFWFNPFIYFIRKAIKLNHEFLADAFVIGGNISTHNYQKILLDFTRKHLVKSPLLASNLNYGFTKKRLNMMVKNTNVWSAILKQAGAIVIITATFWTLGVTEIVAQEVERKSIRFTIGFQLPTMDESKSSPNTASRKSNSANLPFLDNPLMRYELDDRLVEINMNDFTYEERVRVIEEKVKLEYYNEQTQTWNTVGISFKPEQDKKDSPLDNPEIQQYKSDTTKRPLYIRIGAQKTSQVRFTMEDGRKVEKLLKELTPEEYERFRNAESKPEFFLPPTPKVNVSQATFNEFLNEEVYGIWVDGKKVNSNELKKYKPADIHHYNKSKLYRGAKKDKGYTHQLNITTNEHFNNSPNVKGKWIFSSPTDVSNHQKQNAKVKQKNLPPPPPVLTKVNTQQKNRPSPPFKLNQVRFKNKTGELITKKFSDLSESEKKRFRTKAANPEYYVPERPKIVMNKDILDSFLDAKKYGVFLNGKRINNDLLKNYDPKDFHDFRKEKPAKSDNDLGEYEFRLFISTVENFNTLPEFKTGWLPYRTPQVIEVKSDKQKKVKSKGTIEKPQVIEIKSVRDEKTKEKPKVKEVKKKSKS